jgi:hypothetical protein
MENLLKTLGGFMKEDGLLAIVLACAGLIVSLRDLLRTCTHGRQEPA